MKDLSAWWYRICETLGFLRKVYGILTAQLFITVLIGAVCITVPQVRATVQARYVQKALIVVNITHSHINTKSILVISCTHTHTCSALLSIGLVIGTLVVLVLLFFKKDQAPMNYILLLTFVSVECPPYIVCDILLCDSFLRLFLRVCLWVLLSPTLMWILFWGLLSSPLLSSLASPPTPCRANMTSVHGERGREYAYNILWMFD